MTLLRTLVTFIAGLASGFIGAHLIPGLSPWELQGRGDNAQTAWPSPVPIGQESPEGKALLGASTEEGKLDAWRALRSHSAVADSVVQEMTRVGLRSPNPRTRAEVWRQADGSYRSDLLVQPLLQALAADADEKVREEAAETLAGYLDHPGVVEALRKAAEADPDVRKQALKSLGPR